MSSRPRQLQPILGRKVRVLALHGAPANSNVMRFQTAALRRQLGPDVEWIYPDALYETTPTEGLRHESKHYLGSETSAFEERLSQGKPFVSWFRLVDAPATEDDDEPDPEELMTSDQVMMHGSMKQLVELLDKEAPIDVLVAFSQGVLMGTFLANRLRVLGKPIPWRLALLFTSTGPCACDSFEPALPIPAVFVTSPKYHSYAYGVSAMKKLYHEVTVAEHEDGMTFPTTQPRAQEIYQRLEVEFWQHCREPRKRGTWASWCSGSLAPQAPRPLAGAAGRPHDRAEPGADGLRVEVALLAPGALAGLLLSDACLVADSRTLAEVRSSPPFPGSQGDVGLVRLQMAPQAALIELARLRDDGRRVVAISVDGERCEEYSSLLVRRYGFREEQVCRLAGGLEAWEAWEAEHEAEANEVRRAYGLPERRRTPAVAAVSPQDLADSLLAGRCVVADARQANEQRGRPFPGAQREISFYLAEKRPEEVHASLQRLREERRGQPPLRVVAVSACGQRCREYCVLLSAGFGLPEEQVSRLEGGTSAWTAWESANPEQAAELRMACGLPPVRRQR